MDNLNYFDDVQINLHKYASDGGDYWVSNQLYFCERPQIKL